MFCNFCVEACPFDAIILGNYMQQPAYARADLVLQLDQLLEPWTGEQSSSELRVES